jgi:hypothetical protein
LTAVIVVLAVNRLAGGAKSKAEAGKNGKPVTFAYIFGINYHGQL